MKTGTMHIQSLIATNRREPMHLITVEKRDRRKDRKPRKSRKNETIRERKNETHEQRKEKELIFSVTACRLVRHVQRPCSMTRCSLFHVLSDLLHDPGYSAWIK